MATQNDVRKIALSLPGTIEGTERFAFSVEVKGKQKGFVWVWLERKDPKKARTPCPTVLAVRVRDQAEKAVLLAGDPMSSSPSPITTASPPSSSACPRSRAPCCAS